MGWGGDFYSRLVAWMKIILPLVALGLLSTLFLISRGVDLSNYPAVEIDLEQRAQEQGATRPSFAGVTRGGDEITVLAERARPDLSDPKRVIAEDVSAEMRLLRGAIIRVSARQADLHQGRFTADLDGNVIIRTSDGYVIETDRLNTHFDVLHAETPGEIRGLGPPGRITAGKMILTSDAETGDAEILFTKGVKLVYTPDTSKE